MRANTVVEISPCFILVFWI